jgi:hypothetical protein
MRQSGNGGLDEHRQDGLINAMTKINSPNGPAGPENLPDAAGEGAAPLARKPLSDAAKRALAEAEARRAARVASEMASPHEVKGRGGLDPVRYGDWEVKGMASDF